MNRDDIIGPTKRVLDPCCGSRMFWFDRAHPDAVFGDCRRETVTVTDRSRGNDSGVRTLRIEPDVLLDFRALSKRCNTPTRACWRGSHADWMRPHAPFCVPSKTNNPISA